MHWNSKCSWLAWMEVKLMGLRLGNAKSLRCMEVRKCWTAHSHQIIRSSDIIRPRMWHALWVSFSQRPSSSLSFCALRMLHSKVLHLSYQKKTLAAFLNLFFCSWLYGVPPRLELKASGLGKGCNLRYTKLQQHHLPRWTDTLDMSLGLLRPVVETTRQSVLFSIPLAMCAVDPTMCIITVYLRIFYTRLWYALFAFQCAVCCRSYGLVRTYTVPDCTLRLIAVFCNMCWLCWCSGGQLRLITLDRL